MKIKIKYRVLKLTIALASIAFLVLFFDGCKKEVSQNQNILISEASINEFHSYIDSVKNLDSSNNGYLIRNIEWNKAETRLFGNSKILIYAPINITSDNSASTGVLGIMDISENSIQMGYFSQVLLQNGNTGKSTNFSPINTFYDYFNRIDNNFFSGGISFYTLTNNFLLEVDYRNGKNYALKAISSSTKTSANANNMSVGSGESAVAQCVAYYLNTYWDDGTTTSELIGTSCNSPCPINQSIKVDNNGRGSVIHTFACGAVGNISNGGSGSGNAIVVALVGAPKNIPVTILSKNPDGSTTYRFIDSSIPLSWTNITFTLDANNNLIPGSVIVSVYGAFNFVMNPKQNYQQFATSNGQSVDNFSSFFIQGTGGLLSQGFTLPVNLSIVIDFPPASSSPMFSQITATIGYGISIDGGKTYHY